MNVNIRTKQFHKAFNKKKVVTRADLQKEMKVTSRTIGNYLRSEHTLTSYNKNGMYYVLPDVPVFNEYGIWSYDGIHFSKHGNLKQTFIHLIECSEGGLNNKEIKNILQVSPSQMINIFRHLPEIRRKKIENKYTYFSSDDGIYSKQLTSRLQLKKDTQIGDKEGIIIILEKLTNPSYSNKEVSSCLANKGLIVSAKDIDSYFDQLSLTGASDFEYLKCMNNLSHKLISFVQKTIVLSDTTLVFDARNDYKIADGCGSPKTTRKTVYSMMGSFTAKNIFANTENGLQGSRELLSIVAPNCNYAFDIIETVGKMIFHQNKQSSEIQMFYANQGIPISTSQIDQLGKKYIVYLSILHEQSSSKISESFAQNGGYILHIDAMGVKGGERLITGVDSLTNYVLHNTKLSSENKDEIVPFLETIKNRYGTPLRVVQDMGKGILNAVKKVFSTTQILICHYHFLRDIGKDLLKYNYEIIQSRLTHFGFLVKLRSVRDTLEGLLSEQSCVIDDFEYCLSHGDKPKIKDDIFYTVTLYTLLEWTLDWKSESRGYGFPFDRPKYDLCLRMQKTWLLLNNIKDNSISMSTKLEKQFCRFQDIVKEVVEDKALDQAMIDIKPEIIVFDKLREAMRIASKSGGSGLNDDNDYVDVATIESAVTKFMKDPYVRGNFSTKKRMKSFFGQINKYWKQLFADPITVSVGGEKKVIVPQRTNNLMERFFRDFSRRIKRKTGRDDVDRIIRGMVADTPIFKNYEDKEYLRSTLGSQTLSEAFSRVDNELVKERMEELKDCSEKLHPKIQACLDMKNLNDKINELLKN
jgi:hypothetical protein